MANKFHNCLIGMIALVLLGMVILPHLLDGRKKYNKEKDLPGILLVPKLDVYSRLTKHASYYQVGVVQQDAAYHQ